MSAKDDDDEYARRAARRDRDIERRARNFRRLMRAEAIELVKQARKAGLPVSGVTVNGAALTLGERETLKEAANPATESSELDNWLVRHPEHSRSPQRH